MKNEMFYPSLDLINVYNKLIKQNFIKICAFVQEILSKTQL